MISLRLKEQPTVPLEAEVISPDVMADLSSADLAALPLFLGKRQRRLDEFFEIDGAGGDEIEVHGDLSRVKWLGHKMSRGTLRVHGGVGMHLGAHMKGGAIEVAGNASDWVGAEMRGGLIRIAGHAGGQVGGAYRGSLGGMRGGTILVGGNAGLEVGTRMKRGTIVIGGRVRDFAGLQMKGGTILLAGGAEIRTGAWMIRGTIISLVPLELLPTFAYACEANPPILRVLARYLAALGIALPHEPRQGAYRFYSGDASVPGRGEILIWNPAA